ncbi:hypothetical protein PoB_006088700 [Plakobranchus ocellatus]|uniref:Uncharacterized protein n=1 Tax=Plakobranchus ocellatus TaxID=259542 RepID=A0AAV4CR66_9GAST|nr:hypothetical protein PoB_006088700 [Plakobranchus ocellatus]
MRSLRARLRKKSPREVRGLRSHTNETVGRSHGEPPEPEPLPSNPAQNAIGGVGGTVNNETALRSAGIFVLRFRASFIPAL